MAPENSTSTEDPLSSVSREFDAALPSLNNSMSSMVTILIGPDKKPFPLHNELLVWLSDYFRLACTGNWAESFNKIYTFDDVNVQVFELFVRWLYTKRIESINYKDSDQFLILAWALGDRLQCRSFKNAVLNTLHHDWEDYSEYWPNSLDTAALAYQVSPPGSKLRDLLLMKWSLHANEDMTTAKSNLISIPQEFLSDLNLATTRIFMDLRSRNLNVSRITTTLEGNICKQFHKHTEAEPECTKEIIGASFPIHNIDDTPDHCDVFPFKDRV